MQQYATLFQIGLALYCVTSLGLVRKPLLAIAYFIAFRSLFAVASFLKIPSVLGLPFFIPALLCLCLPAASCLLSKRPPLPINRPVFWYLLLLALITIEGIFFGLFGTAPTFVIEEILKNAFPFLAYILVYCGISEEKDLGKASLYILIASLAPVISGWLSYLWDIGYLFKSDTFVPLHTLVGPAGTLIDRNSFGIFLSLCLFHAIPYSLRYRNKKSMLYVLALLATIIVARNRGTWIALSLAFAFSVVVFRAKVNPKKWILGGVALLLISAPVLVARFDQLNEYDRWGQKKDTAEGRLNRSVDTFKLALESPLWGKGPYAFQTSTSYSLMLPHNDYLRIASEYGFPAMLIYLLFFLSQLKWTLNRRNDRLWPYQFASCSAQIYLIILSVAQNILTDTVSYMLIFSLMAISHRASSFCHEKQPLKKRIGIITPKPVGLKA